MTTWDHEFTDKRKRKITFYTTSECITAYHAGRRVGALTLNIVGYDKGRPDEVYGGVADVDAEFQNAGIASEMVRLAFEEHGPIIPPPTYEPEPEIRNSITEDGMRLVLSAQRKGWFREFPDKETPEDFGFEEE
jgi:hypothetical protein